MKRTYGETAFHTVPLERVRPTVEALLGLPADPALPEPVQPVLEAAGSALRGPAERVLLYNPDAIGSWICRRYAPWFAPLLERTQLVQPMLAPVPPVTPVCFASLYAGCPPARHGIHAYIKPVLTVDTLFDALPRAGKRTAIVCTLGDSIAEIFQGRQADYFFYKTVTECNRKAMELLEADQHHCIVLYNGNYDHWMHRSGPTGLLARRALRDNIQTFCALHDKARTCWRDKPGILVFAPDHGCHRRLFPPGDHGVDAPCDRNIVHYYSFLPADL